MESREDLKELVFGVGRGQRGLKKVGCLFHCGFQRGSFQEGGRQVLFDLFGEWNEERKRGLRGWKKRKELEECGEKRRAMSQMKRNQIAN